MRNLLLASLAFGAGSLMAQSTQRDAVAILDATRDTPASQAVVFQRDFGSPVTASVPMTQNVFTTLGAYYPQTVSLPCFNCVTGAVGPTVGMPMPDVNVLANGSDQYVLTNYFTSNNYSGDCTFSFLVRDAAGKYVFKSVFSSAVTAGESIISGTIVSLPNDPELAGTGSALTVTKCGSTAGVSAMQINITNQ